MKKKKIINVCGLFLFTTITFAIAEKVFGVGYWGKLGPNDPKTWSEIYDELPFIIWMGVTVCIIYFFAEFQQEKMEKKNMEEARKKIEGRERIEKEGRGTKNTQVGQTKKGTTSKSSCEKKEL